MSASAAIAMLGLAIQRRLERGTSDDEIDVLISRYRDRAQLLFTVDTLEFLARGGRIGRARKFAGQLLHVKPILTITDGEVVPLTRVRGNQKAMQEFVDRFTSSSEDGSSVRVGIAHADAPERAQALVDMVKGERPQAEIEVVTTLGAVVGTHAGPGTVGFFWFDDVQ
jgi:DegV family protein with EDD domain